jgi:hypothetical protein
MAALYSKPSISVEKGTTVLGTSMKLIYPSKYYREKRLLKR